MHLPHATTFAIATASLALSGPLDLPPNYDRFAPRVENITWGPCPGPDTPTQCGRFEVPLDYQNATAGKASLAVGRYPATKQPKLGTLFFNPGGPGGSGIGFILGATAPFVSNVTGGQYDLVSWDPRGVNWTYPRADCFATGTEQKIFWNDSMPFAGIEARGNFTDQEDLDSFYAQAPNVDELLVKLGQKCLQYGPDTFQYLGTAAVARDIVAMHDYLEGPDKPINFWGVSYGSVLGLYLVNMFPDRVGRVVIDSVTDPEYWSQRPSYEFWGVSIQSADDVFNGFVTNCAAAGPGSCALASNGSTPDSLKQDVQNIIDMAYDYKKTSGANAAFGSALVRSLLRKAMYEPTTWPAAAQSLASVPELIKNGLNSSSPNANMKRSFETGMGLLPHALFPRQQNPSNSSDLAMSYAEPAIVCGDSVDARNVTTKTVFDDIVRVSREVSHMFGATWFSFHFCHRWPVRAVERYTGPFNKSLSNSVLVIGIEADPATPFVSAKKVADAFGTSAVLVEQDDYGHPSLAMYSDCTTAILGNYFRNGTLPSSDQFCATNQALFPGTGITNGAQWRTKWTVSGPVAGSALLLTLILPHLL